MTAMHKLLLAGVLVTATVIACDTKDPAVVTVTGPSPTATSTTTTSVPGPSSTSTSSTTTSIPSLASTRTFVSLGVVPPTVPSQLTIFIQPLTRSFASSLLDYLPFWGTRADPTLFTVTGFYRTSSGGGGQVSGELVGNLDDGLFNGTLTADSPECVAEREFGGSLDPQFLRWTGGRTLRECKGDPLGFSTLVMVATSGPAPTTTPSTSTSTMPLQCGYSLSSTSASFGVPGGTGSVGVITTPACGWTVQNFAPWITVQPASATGAGTVTFAVAANPGPPRSATLIIAGLPFVVNQGIVTTTSTSSSSTSTSSTTTTTTSTTTTVCAYTVNPTAAKYGVFGTDGTDDFDVFTSSGCGWTATTAESWIQVQAPFTGIGPGTVIYAVSCNNTPLTRVGIIRVGNGTFASFQITQAGFSGNTSPCSPLLAKIPKD